MSSKAPFGLWGWGTPLTGSGDVGDGSGIFTANVSYGYPAGMNVHPINQVVVAPSPR